MFGFLLKKYYSQKIPKGYGQRVVVGLSGGVDSSVAAAMLTERGYTVTGAFIKVWQPDFLTCTWKEDRRDAMRICSHLDIPFKTINLEKIYKEKVVEYMVDSYKNGHTPNPDVMCNTYVKFGAFYDWAINNNYEYVATGHYARTQLDKKSKKTNLKRGVDNSKDQSYFVWQIQQEKLARILFPVGSIPKKHVRSIARSYKLATANKKDSQGLCFLGHIDIAEFLSHFITLKKGHIKDTSGKNIGHHKGVALYTIGQRHGFTVDVHDENKSALYITKKEIENNTLTVSHDPVAQLFDKRHVPLRDVYLRTNFFQKTDDLEMSYTAQIRYHGHQYAVVLNVKNKKYFVCFEIEPHGLAVGQSIVFFDNDICVGGGIIDEPMIK